LNLIGLHVQEASVIEFSIVKSSLMVCHIFQS